MKNDFADKIIEILKNKYTSKLSRVELQRHLKISKKNGFFLNDLNKLVNKGHIKKQKEIYSLNANQFQVGKISINRSGLGFVDLPDGQKSILIPSRFINNALNGDIVKIKIMRDESRGPVAKVVQIIGTSYTKLTGQIYIKNMQYFLLPLRGNIMDVKLISPPKSMKIYQDDWVEVEISKRRVGNQLEGVIIDKIEEENELVTELQAAIRQFGLADLYSQEVEEYASNLQPRKIARQDLRTITTLTIDPFNAKDFDDAISLHPSNDENIIIIGVHIADVAAYVTPNKRLHKLIRQRAFTAYLPSKTIPMLPQVLVMARCSLTEMEDKLAHTVMLYINKNNGEILKSQRFHSHIRVDKRLNYEEVQQFIDNDYKNIEWDKSVVFALQQVYEISQKMRQFRRKKEKFLDLALSSFEVLCDYKNITIKGIYEKKNMPSHNLIEEFMLAANVEIAKEVSKKEVPCIFRVHPSPNEEKLIELSLLFSMSFQVECNNLIHRTELNKLLENIRNHPYQDILSFKVLRVMQRALYSSQMSFHYGLGKAQYLHFTSPIRRYSDLLIHLQLWHLDNKESLLTRTDIEDEIELINKKEENIDLANREITNRFKMYYFKKLLEEDSERVFDVVISEIKKRGCIVYLVDFGVYSFIMYDAFSQKYIYHESGMKFFSPSSQQSYYCGDKIKVIIQSVDFRKYEVELKPL